MLRPDIICLTNGVFQENCYLLADPDTRDAALVDPGSEPDLFLRRLEHERLTLRGIWLTHAHVDHILGVAEIVQRTGVSVSLHPADRPLYDRAEAQAAAFGIAAAPLPSPDRALGAGDTLSLGRLRFEVRHVPGHSPGSVALVGHGIALVGDALFAGSVGRVDLPGGDGEQLLASIQRQLLSLPDDTVVYPGHGPETTIGEERRTNPFLTGAIALA